MESAAGPRAPSFPVALTGATGFLGSHIADALLASGRQVRAAVRPTSDLRWIQGKGLQIVTVDLGSTASCAEFVRGCGAVIHCAGLIGADCEDAYRRANVRSTEALLEACREVWGGGGAAAEFAHPVFVLISSLAAHGPAGPDRPARENDPCHPISGYGRSKAAAEAVVGRGWPFRCAVLRPPALYGPRDRGFLPLVRAARRGWTLRVQGPMQALSLVDGRDAARAAVSLLDAPAAEGVFFVDDGQAGYGPAELAAALARACGRRVRTLAVPLWLLRGAAPILRAMAGGRVSVLRKDRLRDLQAPGWVCDGSRLRETTGFGARFRAGDGFADALAFYEEHRWL